MSSEPKKTKYSHLYVALGGVAAGYLFSRSELAASKRSRAEKDDPELTDEACNEIAELLENWEFDERLDSEEALTYELAEYLKRQSGWEIEISPNTPEGKPDILIGDVLALELKLGLEKNERNRLVGQCAGYSRLWVTWAIIIGASESQLGRLEDLLADKGLDHIEVWKY